MKSEEFIQMMKSADLEAIPGPAREMISAIIEERVTDIIVIMQMKDGTIYDQSVQIEPDGNKFAMLGALASVQRDYLRKNIQSPVQYIQRGEDDE